METIKALYQIVTGTEAEFTAIDRVYPLGVATYTISGANPRRMKIADGVNRWTQLPFYPPQASQAELGLIKSSPLRLFTRVNPDGTADINGLETDLTDIQQVNTAQDEQIAEIQTTLAGMSGTIIYIGVVDEYTDVLNDMDDTERDALLTARAIDIRAQLIDGYTLQDLGIENEPGRFSYWQYQDDGSWFNLGERGEVSQASDNDLGIVMGSGARYKIHIEIDGTMSVNGLSAELERLADVDEELDKDIQEADARLSEFEAAQEETNSETARQITDIKAAAGELSESFDTFKAEQLENNNEQDEAIQTAQQTANGAAGAAASALEAAANAALDAGRAQRAADDAQFTAWEAQDMAAEALSMGGRDIGAMEQALPPLFADRHGLLIAARGGTLIELNVTEQPETE